MDIFNVNIYIETSIHGPAVKRAAGMWIVEYQLKNGEPVTREGIILEEKITENALALKLLIEALSVLTKTCSVRVNTECKHILNAIQNQWIAQWEKNHWINAKGELVKNMELWKKCNELLKMHLTCFESGWHAYRNVMMYEIVRKLNGM